LHADNQPPDPFAAYVDAIKRQPTVLGANLKWERERRALSMTRLAKMAGTHASEISRLEKGSRDPRLSTIVRLASAP
jgi:predicted transcriptional regulator